MNTLAICLTDADMALLKKLSYFPALATREIYQIFYSHLAEKHAYRRIGQLVKGDCLVKRPYLGPLYGHANPEGRKTTSLYSLAARGALAAKAGKAPRAFKEQHWLYYFSGCLMAELVSNKAITSDEWLYSGYVKSKTSLERWQPFHALISSKDTNFYIYFLNQSLKKRQASKLLKFSILLKNLPKNNKIKRRYYFIITPQQHYYANLKKLAVAPSLFVHLVTYTRSAQVISCMLKDEYVFLNALVARAGFQRFEFGDTVDPLNFYCIADGKKNYIAEIVSGEVNTMRKIAAYRANLPVYILTFPEQQPMFTERSDFNLITLD